MPAQRELWRSGRRVRVQPKALETVIYLIEHRDRVVGHDELISAVWGRVDVNDNVLCQIISRARLAVGDTGEKQHSIRTIPCFGYRWVRDVETLAPTSAEPDVESRPATEPAAEPDTAPLPLVAHTPPRIRWRVVTVALSLLCATGVVAWVSNDLRATGRHAQSTADTTPDAKLATLRAALKQGRLEQARTLFDTFSDRDRARPEVRFEAAELATQEGRYEDARNAYAALAADLGPDRPLLAGETASGAGWVEAMQGTDHFPAAQQHYEHAIALLRPLQGNEAQVALGRAWSRLGGLHTFRLAFDDAMHAYAEARTALDAAGDRSALCRLENNVGLMFTYQYRTADALSALQRSADLCAQADDGNGEIAARSNLVNVQLGLLQPAAALASEPRLRALRSRLGDPVDASHLDLVRARLLIANGRLSDADAVLRGLAARPTPNDAQLTAVRDIVAGLLAYGRADWKEAAAAIQKALSSKWYTLDNSMATMARWHAIQALRALGDVSGVVKAAEASDAQSRANPDAPDIALYAALARGEAAAALGDAATARTEFERAMAQAERNRSPSDSLQVYSAYTQFLIQHGEKAAARVMADRLDGWANQDFTASLAQLNVYHALGSAAWSSALARTRRLAGERTIPPALTTAPAPDESVDPLVASVQ